MEAVPYPIFRKFENNKSYYKVESSSVMTEIQTMGKFYFIHRLEAKILPERNLIADLVDNEGERWEIISEEDFNNFLKHCQNNLTLKEF